MLTKDQLKQLRGEIVLNSVYLSDYENSLGIKRDCVYDFFDAWLDYEFDCWAEKHPRASAKKRDQYYDSLLDNNDINAMYAYYKSLEYDALPMED